MATPAYKKWIIIGIILLFVVFVAIAVFRSPYKTDRVEDKDSWKGPIVDSGVEESVTLGTEIQDSENPEELAALGDRYFERNQFQQAIMAYEKALKLNPNDVDTYNDLGLALYYTGKSDRAVQTLRKGTEINPSFQRIWLSLGFVLVSIEKNEEAKEPLQKALELDPSSEPGQEAKRILGILK
jgi:tetratricopeptide (TPR) repeat protein